MRLRAISGPKAFPRRPTARGRLHGDLRLHAAGGGARHDRTGALLGACQGDEARRRGRRRHRTRLANGWNFNGTVTVSGTPDNRYRWLVPGTETGPPSGGNTRTATTANDFSERPRPRRLRLEALAHDADEPDRTHGRRQGRREDRLPLRRRHVLEERHLDPGREGRNDHDRGPERPPTTSTACSETRKTSAGSRLRRRFSGQPVEVSLLIDGEPKAKSAATNFDTGAVTVDAGNARGLRRVHDPRARRTLRQQLRLQERRRGGAEAGRRRSGH